MQWRADSHDDNEPHHSLSCTVGRTRGKHLRLLEVSTASGNNDQQEPVASPFADAALACSILFPDPLRTSVFLHRAANRSRKGM